MKEIKTSVIFAPGLLMGGDWGFPQTVAQMNQLSYVVDNKKSLAAGFSYRGNIDRAIRETVTYLKNINSKIETAV